MANNIMNRIYLSGPQNEIDNLVENVRCDGEYLGTVDFNKIIPMPPSLDMTEGGIEGDSVSVYLTAINPDTRDYGIPKVCAEKLQVLLDSLSKKRFFTKYGSSLSEAEMTKLFGKYTEDLLELGKSYVENFERYGCTTWYDFHIKYWGSKWSAYEAEEFSDNMLSFLTAWSNVMPIVLKLSSAYPNLHFSYAWADEDIGTNTGECELEGGNVIRKNIPDSFSKEAYELCSEIWDIDLADEGFIYSEQTGTYECNECEGY